MKIKKFKINLVDLIIICIILVMLVFFGLKFNSVKEHKTKNYKKVYITLCGESVANYIIDKDKIGNNVLDDENNIVIGKVVDIQTADSINYFLSDDETTAVEYKKEGYSSLKLVIEGWATQSEYGAVIDNALYSVGHTSVWRSGFSKYYIQICDIEFSK